MDEQIVIQALRMTQLSTPHGDITGQQAMEQAGIVFANKRIIKVETTNHIAWTLRFDDRILRASRELMGMESLHYPQGAIHLSKKVMRDHLMHALIDHIDPQEK